MQDIALTAKSHLDFSGLGELKAKAQQNQQGAAEEVGRQFEAMFVQMIFKSMREANQTMKSDLMSSSNADTFEQMYHDELSQVMAQKGVFGLGDWLVDQVNGQPNAAKAVKAYEQDSLPSIPLNRIDSAKDHRFPLPDGRVTRRDIMVDILSIGAGATQLYRSALTTVSNNIANMNTEGYTRQVTDSEQSMPVQLGGMYFGNGSHLGNITRAFSEFNEGNLRNSSSELSTQDPLIKYADRIVDLMGSGTSSLSSALDQFFTAASNLSSDPASRPLRNLFLRDADGLAIRFRELSGQLSNIEQETQAEINSKLTTLNELGKQLVTVNEQLAKKATSTDSRQTCWTSGMVF